MEDRPLKMKNINNLFDLSEKVIVITGGAGLLGFNHAEAILESGGHPIIIDINKSELDNVVHKLNARHSGSFSAYNVDITNEDEVVKLSKKIKKNHGKLDGLVNNAAINPKVEKGNENFSRMENFQIDQWNSEIKVGLTGSFICSKNLGYLISKNPNGGTIVNISSDLGLIAPNQGLYKINGKSLNEQPVKPITYSVIKAGIIGLTRYIATYWPNLNVRCNAICPGGIKDNQSEEFLKKISDLIPMGRLANQDEYKGALIWLLSDASSYLNGAIIPIDGGRTVW